MYRPWAAVAVLVAAVVLAGCGDRATVPLKGAVVRGPGMLTTSPPWPAQYRGIKHRVAPLGLPAPGNEKFHIHQVLHIYNDGILVPVAANIGVDPRQDVEIALHTHDGTGVIHMEAGKRFRATLGDLFTVWGVSFGPDHLGALKASDERPFTVLVNGRTVADPAAHVLRKDDNIVIAYGSMAGVPRIGGTTALRAANGKGRAPAACSVGKNGKKPTSCFADKQR